MDKKIGFKCLVILVILLSHSGLISSGGGEEEGLTAESMSDALEEVSIEAVEDDFDGPSSPAFGRGGGGSSGESESFQESQSYQSSSASSSSSTPSSTVTAYQHQEFSSSDNSTAVATVYPDINGNLSSINGSLGNSTGGLNGTGASGRFLRVKVTCAPFLLPDGTNVTAETETAVEIVNMTYLLHGILISNPTVKTRATPSNCTIIMFFAHWCPWSAKAAPHFNALPRAYKNIRFAAIDSSLYTAVNTYFGILSVPSVVLFFNGKILAKFNETTFSVNHFSDFITTYTDQKPGIRLNVTSNDFVGPLPSTITKYPDIYLYMSWLFIICCLIYYFSRTALWHRIMEMCQTSWREAEAVNHHFHQD